MELIKIKRKRHGGNICPECARAKVCENKSSTITGCSGYTDVPCPYCEGETNDFIPLNQTVEYSGVEIALNRQGMLRVRVYEPGQEAFTTQDIVEIKHCPYCGSKMDGDSEKTRQTLKNELKKSGVTLNDTIKP